MGNLAGALAGHGVHVEVLTRGAAASGVSQDARDGRDLQDGRDGRDGRDLQDARDGRDGRDVIVHRVPTAPVPRDLERFLAWVADMNRALLATGALLAEQRGFDLVHGHDWLVAGAVRGMAERLDVPLLVTVHATEHGRHAGSVGAGPQAQIDRAERELSRAADGLISCSEYMRDHVVAILGVEPRRVTVIPNGIEPLAPAADTRVSELCRRHRPPQERLVLLVGRLVYEKGFQLALAALAEVIHSLGGVRFVVAGSGPHEAQLRAQAQELGLGEHGSFLGWVGDEELGALYRIADVCVVPSIYEPFGLVALEAMACGCACLVADTGGLREVVPHRAVGRHFRAEDPHALARELIDLLRDDAARARIVAEAREHAQRFDWGSIAVATAEVYRRLIAARELATPR